MCDYSLYSNQTRLAEEGEELVLRRFETGSLGFASAADIRNAEAAFTAKCETFWATIKDLLIGRSVAKIPAICIPPGARLLLSDLSEKVQKSLGISSLEAVVFTEISNRSYSYRDAVVLSNGTRMLLQDLPEGVHAVVLSMSPEPSTRQFHEELRAA